MSNWKKCENEMPVNPGMYLLCFGKAPARTCFIDVGEFHPKGTVVFHKFPEHNPNELSMENLYRSLFESEPQYAPEDAFYAYDDNHFWFLRPDYWMKIPDAPDGMDWLEV